MTDEEDNIIRGKNVFDDNNQERKSWSCLAQTCSRSLIVILSQFSMILLINFGCFWRKIVSKIFDDSFIRVGKLCGALGYILPSPGLCTN